MKLETKLKRLVAQLPAKQQMLDLFGDNLWQELSRDDQQACRRAIAGLMLQVLIGHESNDDKENDEHE